MENDLPEVQIYDEKRILSDFETYVGGQRRLNELRQLLIPGDHVTSRALERAPTGLPEQRKQHARLRELEKRPDQNPALVVLFALIGSRTFQDDLRGKTRSQNRTAEVLHRALLVEGEHTDFSLKTWTQADSLARLAETFQIQADYHADPQNFLSKATQRAAFVLQKISGAAKARPAYDPVLDAEDPAAALGNVLPLEGGEEGLRRAAAEDRYRRVHAAFHWPAAVAPGSGPYSRDFWGVALGNAKNVDFSGVGEQSVQKTQNFSVDCEAALLEVAAVPLLRALFDPGRRESPFLGLERLISGLPFLTDPSWAGGRPPLPPHLLELEISGDPLADKLVRGPSAVRESGFALQAPVRVHPQLMFLSGASLALQRDLDFLQARARARSPNPLLQAVEVLAAARFCEVEVELRRAFNLSYYYLLSCGAGLACVDSQESGKKSAWGEPNSRLRLSEREVRIGALGEMQDTARKTEDSGKTSRDSRAGSVSASRAAKQGDDTGAPAVQKEFEYTVVDSAGREVCLAEAERELGLALDFVAQRFLGQAAGLKPDELEKHGRVLLLSLAEEELERVRLVNSVLRELFVLFHHSARYGAGIVGFAAWVLRYRSRY